LWITQQESQAKQVVDNLGNATRDVRSRDEQVERRDDGAFKLRAAAGVHGGGRERFPDDALALVRRDEKRNTGP
jgi:hypothetical protein|tara:strand:+ start:388 stop:609 length:222 start_codon:yes stop_codon:yes gene_type:complete